MDTSTLAVLPKKKEGNRVPILRQKLKKVIIWLTNLRHADGALISPPPPPPPPPLHPPPHQRSDLRVFQTTYSYTERKGVESGI